MSFDLNDAVKTYGIPMMAGGMGIVPIIRFWERKCDRQLGRPSLSTTALAALERGVKAAPIIGLTVGAQVAIQGKLEGRLTRPGDEPTVAAMAATTAAAAGVTSPFLALFNARAAGMTVIEGLKAFRLSQAAMITARETGALGGYRFSLEVRKRLEEWYGVSTVTRVAAAAVGGFSGSVATHPIDTMLTRTQAGAPIRFHLRSLFAGGTARSCGGALFTVGFTESSRLFERIRVVLTDSD